MMIITWGNKSKLLKLKIIKTFMNSNYALQLMINLNDYTLNNSILNYSILNNSTLSAIQTL